MFTLRKSWRIWVGALAVLAAVHVAHARLSDQVWAASDQALANARPAGAIGTLSQNPPCNYNCNHWPPSPWVYVYEHFPVGTTCYAYYWECYDGRTWEIDCMQDWHRCHNQFFGENYPPKLDPAQEGDCHPWCELWWQDSWEIS